MVARTPFQLGGSGRAHLKVQGLSAGYGPFLVLRELTLEARPGLTVILGPNGAGKTTLLKALAGLIPKRGIVTLDGEDLPREDPSRSCAPAWRWWPKGRQLFPQMTVTENLELGGWLVPQAGTRTAHRGRVQAAFPSCANARSSWPAR